MATHSKPTRHGGKMTLLIGHGEGLAAPPAIPFRMAPAVPTDTGRLTAHTYCGHRNEEGELDCLEQFKAGTASYTTRFCQHHGYDAETITMYETDDGRKVEVDTSGLGPANSKELRLDAIVDRKDVPDLYVEKAFLMWPEPGAELAFDQFAAAVRVSKKVLVGKAVISKATRAIVVSWDDHAQTLIAQACTFPARVALEDVELIRAGIQERPQPSDKDAKAIVSGLLQPRLADSFDFDAMTDEYAADLQAAFEAAVAGVPAPVRAQEEEATPVFDLMAAMKQSVAEQKPKRKAKQAA